MSTPYNQTLAPCGTYAARARHRRNNVICETCGPIGVPRKPLSPCGTKAAKRRHAKRGETCVTCTPAPRPPLQPCGTTGAWHRHVKRGETPCEPCKQAYRDKNNARRWAQGVTPLAEAITPLPALIEELTFLLNAGEGEARILEATGYTGREDALRERLRKNGHHDLAARIFTPWELAA